MERRVVITGLGAVTPVGLTAAETWDALKAGACGVGPITHFDTEGYKVSVAAEVKGFDPLDHLTKVEAKRNDRATQFALAASDEAVADARLVIAGSPRVAASVPEGGQAPEPNVAAERVGTFVGSGIGGFQTTVEQVEKIHDEGPRKASPFMIPMMIANMPCGAVSMRHHATGPTLPVVTACATSAHEVGEAFRAVKHGYCDAALAGGTEASIIGPAIAGFTSCMALTKNPDPATACRPFDVERDGFVMGEGACVLVLEDLEHARARGAKVYAEVVGYGNTDDAHHITSPDPDASGIARAVRLAVEEGGVRPEEGLYVNAHGTSTRLNDSSETLGLKRALGEKAARAAHVSSTKSMTGHMIGATGAVEVMACALALRDGVVPPTINYRTPDPACDLDYTPNKAVACELAWALSTNLGFGGHNACVALRAAKEA